MLIFHSIRFSYHQKFQFSSGRFPLSYGSDHFNSTKQKVYVPDLGRDSRQQFKKMRAYWKTFRLTNLIHYNNYLPRLPVAWRGSLSFLIGQMRDRYQASTNAQFGQSHYKFASAIPADTTLQLYLFKLKGRMVLCTKLKRFYCGQIKPLKPLCFVCPQHAAICMHLIYC